MTETAVLTKTELVENVASARHLLNRDAEFIVNAVFDCIVRSLEPGCSEVELRGFGTSTLAIELLRSHAFGRAPVVRGNGFRDAEASV